LLTSLHGTLTKGSVVLHDGLESIGVQMRHLCARQAVLGKIDAVVLPVGSTDSKVGGIAKVQLGLLGRGLVLVRHLARDKGRYLHLPETILDDVELTGGSTREVDDELASVRAAVGDTHYDLLAVREVADTKQCAQRITHVGARHAVLVVALAIGHTTTV
jgi:hypothetical protein